MQTALVVALWALSVILALFIGGFLKSYMKQKGENLATHEDIDKLVDQMKAVTEATKKIEAEISTGIWDKQKRWEMKREVLFEAAKRMSEVDDALLGLSIAIKEDHKKQKAWEAQSPEDAERLSWMQLRGERFSRWSKASTEFDESRVFVTVVCGEEASQAFAELGAFVNKLSAEMTRDPESYDKSRSELFTKLLRAQKAMRKELEVDS
jgi:hypothetical protein